MNDLIRNMNRSRTNTRYDQWKAHREIASSLLYDHSIQERNNIIIFGGGNCDDIDLMKLINTHNEITFVDIDILATKAAINRQGIKNIENIHYIEHDLSGLSQIEFYQRVYDLISNLKFDELKLYIRSVSESLKLSIEELRGKKYSVVVAGAIHSQLIAVLGMMLEKAAPQIDIYDELDDLHNTISINFNKLLMNVLGDKGTFIGWFDIVEIENENRSLVYNAIKNYTVNNIIENYNIDLISGAYHGLIDLQKVMEYKVMKYWNWKLDVNKEYLVIGTVMSKK